MRRDPGGNKSKIKKRRISCGAKASFHVSIWPSVELQWSENSKFESCFPSGYEYILMKLRENIPLIVLSFGF